MVYTVTEMLTRARSILQARTTDSRLTNQERNRCQTAVTTINSILTRIDPVTNLDPPATRQADADTLLSGVNALNATLIRRPDIAAGDLYDAVDIGQAAAACIAEGRPTESLVLSDGL